MTPEQWAQMMGLPAPTTAPTAADAAAGIPVHAAPTGALANLDLSSLFGNLGGTTTGATPAHGGLASADLQRAMMGLGSPAGQGQRERPPALQVTPLWSVCNRYTLHTHPKPHPSYLPY